VKPLFFLFQRRLFKHKVGFGGLITFLVNQFVKKSARELVKLFLHERNFLIYLCIRSFERLAVLVRFFVNERADKIGLLRRNGERLYKLKALVNDGFFLRIWLGTNKSCAVGRERPRLVLDVAGNRHDLNLKLHIGRQNIIQRIRVFCILNRLTRQQKRVERICEF